MADCGSFLSGCILVDVHAFHEIERRDTHFVGRVDEVGEDAYRTSCAGFLGQLAVLLQPAWAHMSQAERAFVTGYLCHLATDECWKQLGWQLFQELNISSWADFPVPGDVSLTAFDFLSAKLLLDPATARAALQAAAIPDVFNHIPHAMLVHQWEIIQDYVWNGGTPEAYVRMLAAAGEPIAEF